MRLGKIVADGLKEFAEDLTANEKVSTKYNMRRVVVDLQPETYGPNEVRDIRRTLNASQSVFAMLLGVSVKSVQKWEQGETTPSSMACRFMDEIAQSPEHFRHRIEESIKVREEPVS